MKEEQFNAALSFLKLAIENNPFHLEARKELAQCLFELKDYQESYKQWRIASRLDPQDAQLFVNSAIALIAWNNPDFLPFGILELNLVH
jgi:tetratricopeptide (TPR) repeat protein